MSANSAALLQEGAALQRQGRLAEAEGCYVRALELEPANGDAIYHLGVLACQQGDLGKGIALFRRCVATHADHARAHNLLGLALMQSGAPLDALQSFDRAVAIQPDLAEAHGSRADLLAALGRRDEALASFDRALALRPDSPDDWCNRGSLLHEMKKHDAAIASFDRALALRPDFATAHFNRANVFAGMECYAEALAGYDRAASLDRLLPGLLSNRAQALKKLGRYDEALAVFAEALQADARDAGALLNRAQLLKESGRLDEALKSCDAGLALAPQSAPLLGARGDLLAMLGRHGEALDSYAQAVKIDPSDLEGLAQCALSACDWATSEALAPQIAKRIAGGEAVMSPFTLLGYVDDPALVLACARNPAQQKAPFPRAPLWTGSVWRNEKIRVAYLSSDFRTHALAFVLAELFELHDRARFEIVGISHGIDDGSGIRRRLAAAFDRFHDVRDKSDQEIAALVNRMPADILVDLNNYTSACRPGILAFRPAPIQVNYLAAPSTMGRDFMDYIIADGFVLPEDQQPFYTESIVRLPDCYHPTDSKPPIAASAPGRREYGLPEDAFVFCCFNTTWKITPRSFDVWMRLLARVEGSVLWLRESNATAADNLRREAQTRGIDPARLVFAQGTDLPLHLARQRLADLFLDTLPYNAHSTAAEALAAGLPVLTCAGRAFPGRVAGSMLRAIGLPELVTGNMEDYEALAFALATEPGRLPAIREKLAANRHTQPLFDMDRYRRHLEAAYTTMWETWQRGDKPRAFRVNAV